MAELRPAFLGIGAHRAGTTWLFKQLRNHPGVWIPPKKELHYFDRDIEYPSPNDLSTVSLRGRILGPDPWERPRTVAGARTVMKIIRLGQLQRAAWWCRWYFGRYDDRWYRGLFAQAPPGVVCGEITPSYSILQQRDVARIKDLNPGMKLIFLIRNPIERAWSALRFNVARGLAKTNLDSENEIITALQAPGAVLRGDYERTLDTYLEHFDPAQILVCFHDAITRDPAGLMAGIAAFLGLVPFRASAISSGMRVNQSPPGCMPGNVRAYLRATYAPMIGRIAGRLGSYAAHWEEVEYPRGRQMPWKGAAPSLPATVHPHPVA